MLTSPIHTRLRSSLLLGAAVSAIATGAASAQDTTEGTSADSPAIEFEFETIVVTANKRQQTLQEVPVAVSVVSGDLIEDAQIVDLIDLQASVPSLRVVQLQTSSSTNFFIRGFGNGSNNPGIDPSVGVFVDGVFRSRASSAIFDFPTVERVEVLRGPQSTLFGKNVSVGAINLTTKAPTHDWEGSVEATVGNLDALRFRGTLSGPISDTLAFRVTGTTNKRDGTYTNLVTGDDNINERDRWSVRGQLLWEPSDQLTFRLIGDYDKLDEACCGMVFLEQGPVTTQVIGGLLGATLPPADAEVGDRLTTLSSDPSNVLEGKGVSLQTDWDTGWATITSITAYRDQYDFNSVDGDFTGAHLVEQPRELNFSTFTQELRMTGEWETGIGTFNWLVGGFFFDEDLQFQVDATAGADFRGFGDILLNSFGTNFAAIEGATQLIGALTANSALTGPALFPELAPAGGPDVLASGSSYAPGTGFLGAFDQKNRQYTIFFQTDWEITDRLTLTAGLGYTKDRKEVVGNIDVTDPFQSLDLSQFATSGISLEAAALLGQAIGTPFNPADPTAFFQAAAIASATSPTFALDRAIALQTAVANATAVANGQAAPSPFLAAGLGLTQLGALQFLNMHTPFPAAGAVRDNGNTLSDDGYLVDDAFTYTARVAYDLTDNINTYFSYSTGYKPAAANLSQTTQAPSVAPDGSIVGRFAEGEEVEVFEIGAKFGYDWGYINIALFDQTVNNFQSSIFTGTGQQLENAGKQNIRGVEFEAAYSPVRNLNLFLGVTYLDPEFTSFEAASCPAPGFIPIADPAIVAQCAQPGVTRVDISGTRPPGIHEFSVSTSASYTFDLGGGRSLTPRIEYLYESEVELYAPSNGLAPTREVNQINANILLQVGNGLAVNFWGRNLTNDASIFSFANTLAQVGSYNGFVTPPRQWGVSIRKEF